MCFCRKPIDFIGKVSILKIPPRGIWVGTADGRIYHNSAALNVM